MCGRFAFFSPHEAIERLFGVVGAPPVEPRYNIAPTNYVPAVRVDSEGVRRLAMLYWGLVPSWAKEKAIGARMINARAETLKEKPSFRTAYKRRRCLVLANGYYEWQAVAGGKQPWYFHMRDDAPFAFAGLWESWVEKPGERPLESCTVITTGATPRFAHIHDRMPVIVPRDAYGRWIDAASQDAAALDALLVPYAGDDFTVHPVSRRVSNARNQGADLIEPVPAATEG
jgi:putative SOS response-associated peptidase YedK